MRRSLPGLIVLLVLAAGCGGQPGTPTPERSTDNTTSGRTTPSTSNAPRPREVKLDHVKPCDLLTTQQLSALRIDRPGREVASETYESTGCTWTVNGANNRLVPVTKEGIGVWSGGSRTGRPAKIDPILGFAAITVTLPSDERHCDVMVDTTDGQYLVAAFTVSPSFVDQFPKPCDGARRLAEAAMQNLLK
ncbi:DUF3558 domain-containing protein [Saccharothrix australiensis]|uniref:Uncharacterized protein DUF3558 n=1 Tax=Saccharothrix australiensis TaxID=2072 RepID=A0A495VXZ1_9PSEU|nr:DUF3558 domain-containing protein [Saccharothrix australiensis]RKT53453.1 uncharacterized protein DUF3558 [Saccharothrix australiensis]